jgi:hypothetical protein
MCDSRQTEILRECITSELVRIPTTLWGHFFAIQVALWRFLRSQRPDRVPPVYATWWDKISTVPARLDIEDDRYVLTRFTGGIPPGSNLDHPDFFTVPPWSSDALDRLMSVFWEEGDVLDLTEKLAYFASNNVDRQKFRSGSIERADVPDFRLEDLQALANALILEWDSSER